MPVRWNMTYMGIRTTAWLILWLIVNIDGIKNRRARGSGWKLHWVIRGMLTVQVIYEYVHLSVIRERAITEYEWDVIHSNRFKAEIFFQYLSESVFMFLLLLVSSGYCITRESLGDLKSKVISFPLIYGITGMIADYIVLTFYNPNVLTGNIDEEYETTENVKATVFVFCLALRMFVFIISWLMVIENLCREIRILHGIKDEDIEAQEEDETGQYNRPTRQDEIDRSNDEHNVEAVDGPTTVEEIVTTKRKLDLLIRFRLGLVLYVVANVYLKISMIYMSSNESAETIQNVVDIVGFIILYVFVLSLSWIFRPKDDNPYLILDDENTINNNMNVTTELGVLYANSDEDDVNEKKDNDKEKVAVDGKFSLDDNEDMTVLNLHDNESGNTPTTPQKEDQHRRIQ